MPMLEAGHFARQAPECQPISENLQGSLDTQAESGEVVKIPSAQIPPTI